MFSYSVRCSPRWSGSRQAGTWFGACHETWKGAPPWLFAPTVGALLDLLEENYWLLHCLAPDLRQLSGAHCASGNGTDLFLDVIEQAPYTTIVRLTYHFSHLCAASGPGSAPQRRQADPDARLRVCHDARQVEVIGLRQTVLPLAGDHRLATLKSKWNANWFVSKWLSYCVQEHHRFFSDQSRPPCAEFEDSAPAA